MSVINKMLRDLDHRQATRPPGSATGTTAPATAALRQGTASVGRAKLADIGTPKDRSYLWLGLVGITVVAALGGWVWWSANTASVPVAAAPQTTNPAPPSAAGTAIADIAASAPAASKAPSTNANAGSPEPASGLTGAIAPAAAMNLRMESSLSAQRALDALLSTPPAPVAAASAPVPADRPKARPTVANTAQPTAPATDTTTAPAIQRQQQAGGDAIAQAQSLWNSGSHDAAIELMQQSVAATERSLKAGTAPGSNTVVLVPLVREMARMQLAESRFGAVWEMLTRLEPLLGNQADLWAIRANAAQRLGRHPDSVHAYMMALQTRPDEQRWLLGTAVSLAALGQTASAAEMAEKARAVGPVGKDISVYLRQAGVPLRE